MKRHDVASTLTPDTEVPGSKPVKPEPSALQKLRIGQALLATTWRIVVPVLIFTGLGISLDLRFGSKPWLTLVGVVVGFSMAGVLIARLIKESEKL